MIKEKDELVKKAQIVSDDALGTCRVLEEILSARGYDLALIHNEEFMSVFYEKVFRCTMCGLWHDAYFDRRNFWGFYMCHDCYSKTKTEIDMRLDVMFGKE